MQSLPTRTVMTAPYLANHQAHLSCWSCCRYTAACGWLASTALHHLPVQLWARRSWYQQLVPGALRTAAVPGSLFYGRAAEDGWDAHLNVARAPNSGLASGETESRYTPSRVVARQGLPAWWRGGAGWDPAQSVFGPVKRCCGNHSSFATNNKQLLPLCQGRHHSCTRTTSRWLPWLNTQPHPFSVTPPYSWAPAHCPYGVHPLQDSRAQPGTTPTPYALLSSTPYRYRHRPHSCLPQRAQPTAPSNTQPRARNRTALHAVRNLRHTAVQLGCCISAASRRQRMPSFMVAMVSVPEAPL